MSASVLSRTAAAALLLLALYLWGPALHAVQLEGFTSQTTSIALLRAHAPGVAHDPDLPAVTQFITQSRSAVIAALAVAYAVAGPGPGDADLAYQGLVLLSFAALVLASLRLARHWAGTPWLAGFAALLLTPGAAENAFFFNDNIVSAALAVCSLLCVTRHSGLLRCALAGVLLALAVLARIDAVLLAPALLGLVLLREGARSPWPALAWLGGTAAAVLALAALWQGFSLLDAVHTAGQFVIERPRTRWLSTRVLFFGLAALPLLAIGAWTLGRELWRQRRVVALLTWVAYPVALALLAPLATETRYVFPLLTPWVALHGARGLQVVLDGCRRGLAGGRAAWGSWAVLAWIAAVLCAPTTMVLQHDGPRSVLGRLWSPALWAQWQQSVVTSNARQRELARALADHRRTLLVSTHFNDEWSIRLRLFELGFVPDPAHGSVAGCSGISVYRRAGSEVLHVRTESQYGLAPLRTAENAALQLAAALQCPRLQPLDAAYVTTWGSSAEGLLPQLFGFGPETFPAPLEQRFPDLLLGTPLQRPLKAGYAFGMFSARPLDPQALPALAARAEAARPAGLDIEAYGAHYRARPGPTQPLLADLRRRMMP